MGDFNIDLLNSDNNYYNTFVNILQANSFIGAIDKPTRMTQNTSTLKAHCATCSYLRPLYNKQ